MDRWVGASGFDVNSKRCRRWRLTKQLHAAKETTGPIYHSGHGSQIVSVVDSAEVVQHGISGFTWTVGTPMTMRLLKTLTALIK